MTDLCLFVFSRVPAADRASSGGGGRPQHWLFVPLKLQESLLSMLTIDCLSACNADRVGRVTLIHLIKEM